MNIIYTFTIFPIEIIYERLFTALYYLVHNYGYALILLALCSFFLVKPLEKLVQKYQKKEQDLQKVLTPQLNKIKVEYHGAERHQKTISLYKRYSYHPIYAIRSSLSLLIQVPLLIAAYNMISSYSGLNQPFGIIDSLAKPDGLLFGINLLPFLMTFINIATTYTTKNFSKANRLQAIAMAAMFLILLYNAPSALLVYWTANNLFSLIKNFIPKQFSKVTTNINFQIGKGLKCILPNPLNSFAILLVFMLFTPFFFILVNNLHGVAASSMWLALGVFLVLVAKLFIFGIILDFIQRVINKKLHTNKNLLLLINVVFFTMIMSFALFLVENVIVVSYYIHSETAYRITYVLMVLLSVGIAIKYTLKPINIFLICFFFISFIRIPFEINKNEVGGISIVAESNERFGKIATNTLQNTPNIYLIYLESFHNFKTMENEYNISTGEMRQTLTDYGFNIYDNTFANSYYTLTSMRDLFLMESASHESEIGNYDTVSSVRDMIGGSEENTLFAYLKSLGYYTSAYYNKDPSYYTFTKGKFLDTLYFEEYLHNPTKKVEYFYTRYASFLQRYVAFLLKIILGKSDWNWYELKSAIVMDVVNEEIPLIKVRSQPNFFMVKGGTLHTWPGVHYDYNKNFQEFIPMYQKAVQVSYEQEILPILKMIQENDPNAVVVLLGDHGASSLRNIVPLHENNYDVIFSRLDAYNKNIEDFANSWFGVFLAVKMPDYAQQDISYGSPISPVNLFRHIFAAIDNNKAFLEHRVPNTSRWGSQSVIVEEGEIINRETVTDMQ